MTGPNTPTTTKGVLSTATSTKASTTTGCHTTTQSKNNSRPSTKCLSYNISTTYPSNGTEATESPYGNSKTQIADNHISGTSTMPLNALQTGEIAGIAVGGVVFLIIVTVIIVCSIIFLKRKKCKKEPSQSVNGDGKRPSNSNVNSNNYYESVDSGCLNGARENSFVYDTPARVEIPPDYMIKPVQTTKNKNKKTNGGLQNQMQCSRPGDNRVSLKPGANAFVSGSEITTINGSVVTLMPENDSTNTSSSSDDIHAYYNEAAVNGWKTSDVGIEPQYSEVRVHAKAATPKPARVDSAEDGDLFLVDNNLYGQF